MACEAVSTFFIFFFNVSAYAGPFQKELLNFTREDEHRRRLMCRGLSTYSLLLVDTIPVYAAELQ